MTNEEEETYVIVSGLEGQAEVHEAEAARAQANEKVLGFSALMAFGGAMALEFIPQDWTYEKYEIAAVAGALAISAIKEQIRWRMLYRAARRKREVAEEQRAQTYDEYAY